MSLEATVQKTIDELLAEAAIKDIQIRYCRSVDRVDFDLMRSCFHPGATLDYGIYAGDVEGFIDLVTRNLQTYPLTTHFTGNQLVEVRGAKAWAEHYAVATHRLPADDQGPVRDFVTAIRYVDRVEQRDDDWRIAERICILDWWRMDPAPVGEGPPVLHGKQGRDDASYRWR